MKRLTTTSKLAKCLSSATIVITVNIITGIMIQPASAQIVELGLLAGTALNALFNKKPKPAPTPTPQPLPERNVTVGTDNLNGNNFNFSLLPDLNNPTGNNNINPLLPIPQNRMINQQSIPVQRNYSGF